MITSDFIDSKINTIINGDCLEIMKQIPDNYFDCVVTSPPYNLNVKRKGGDEYNKKYSNYKDEMSNEDYINWQLSLLKELNRITKKNKAILYNINYGGENNETMWILLGRIIAETNLTIADQIIWKKSSAIPNNRSKNKLTRIVENVFVLVDKSHYMDFETNKKIVSKIEKTGQNNYENIYNYFEAPNNNQGEHTKIHKATFSTEMVNKLLGMYFKEGAIFDPFMGSGTTAVACKSLGIDFVGCELESDYVAIANKRLEAVQGSLF